MKKLTLVLSTLLLAACANNTVQTKDDFEKPLSPAYMEKATPISISQYKADVRCPSGVKWKKWSWRKIVKGANACVKAKDWDQVKAIGDELAIKAYTTPWGPYYLSLVSEARKNYPRALWLLDLAIKKAPREGIFLYQRGRLDWQTGDNVAALGDMRAAIRLTPELGDAQWIIGEIDLQRQNYSGAQDHLQAALKQNPQHLPSLMTLAELRLATHDWVAAESTLKQVVELNPQSAKARLALASVEEEHLNKLEAALDGYKRLRKLASQRRLDQTVEVDLNLKIQTLEKQLAQAVKVSETRQPSSDKAVTQ